MTMTVITFRSLRSDSNYKLFWVKVTATAAQLGVHEAQFPYCRKAHKRYEQGGMDSHHFPTIPVEEQIYFEALVHASLGGLISQGIVCIVTSRNS